MASNGRFCILRTAADGGDTAIDSSIVPPATTLPPVAATVVDSPATSPATVAGETTVATTRPPVVTAADGSTLAPTTSTSTIASADRNTTEEDDGSACFPPAATTELEDGRVVRMEDLQIGDRVRVSAGKYSPVFAFTHRDPVASATYVRLSTECGATVRATAGHYLRVNGGLMAAGRVQVGDWVETAAGLATRVTQKHRESGRGLYNPQTLDGEIVVDGILASTYTTAVAPSTAHAWLAPVRLVYQLCGLYTTSFDRGAEEIVKFLPRGSGAIM